VVSELLTVHPHGWTRRRPWDFGSPAASIARARGLRRGRRISARTDDAWQEQSSVKRPCGQHRAGAECQSDPEKRCAHQRGCERPGRPLSLRWRWQAGRAGRWRLVRAWHRSGSWLEN